MPEWLPLFVSATAILVSGASVAVVAALARRSPPGIVARAAGQLEAHEADVDTRVRKLETDVGANNIYIDNVLEEIQKSAADASKRNKSARRSEQAAEARGDGDPLQQLPAGHPGRIAAIESMARKRRG